MTITPTFARGRSSVHHNVRARRALSRVRVGRVAGVALLLALLALTACGDRSGEGGPDNPTRGVALALAEQRAAVISELRYDATFDVPLSRDSAVTGTVDVRFVLRDTLQPLVLDFRAPPDHVLSVRLNGDEVPYTLPDDHIVIPGSALSAGEQTVTVAFRSTNDALNRQDEFFYALFVPDRASTALPIFEQPDLKARFTLTLTVPSAWKALANGAEVSRETLGNGRDRVRFAESAPISTYLFSFAAGVLQVDSAQRDGRTLTMYHRESDREKFARNRDAIYDLHATAITWLEDYTQIEYPFDKFAFFAIPAFQFGGMEHPGAIWYRAETLFLDPSASRTQELGRASLIAHETAHMWFGDLVTMRWFNDVWMKEVFANFMAAKIAGPSFPDINLNLRFFQAHHPAAYNVDRTAGTNAIRQPLENLRDAGSLYGAIIYQKAPIVMQQLESLVGESVLRDGLRLYLDRYRYGNATWTDLVGILDSLSTDDLATWSQVWVNEAGRPRVSVQWADSGLLLTQNDAQTQRNLRWPQTLVLALGGDSGTTLDTVVMRERESFVPLLSRPGFVLPAADGVGYGRFVLDHQSRMVLLSQAAELQDPLHRAVAFQSLWEEVLEDSLAAEPFARATLAALREEDNELVAQQLLGLLRGAYWRFIPDAVRVQMAPEVEAVLWTLLDSASTAGRKGAYFSALTSLSLSDSGVVRLERIWRKEQTPVGLPLEEQQYIALAEALALRNVANAEQILTEQESRITNPDRLARFKFMRPALSASSSTRDSLFATFANVENRRRESWVLDAMSAMHHPLRSQESVGSVRASLDLVQEIQATGDIFFPLRWLSATLDGHRSAEAAEIVRAFLRENPGLPPRLRGKVLQAADDLFRVTAQ